jgi:hypothetical protein
VVEDHHQKVDNEERDQKESIDSEVTNERGSHVKSKFRKKKKQDRTDYET